MDIWAVFLSLVLTVLTVGLLVLVDSLRDRP